MLKNSSRETFMKKNIYNIGEIGKSERYLSLLFFFVWFQLFLLVFQEATLKKNVKAEQGFRLCFYQET